LDLEGKEENINAENPSHNVNQSKLNKQCIKKNGTLYPIPFPNSGARRDEEGGHIHAVADLRTPRSGFVSFGRHEVGTSQQSVGGVYCHLYVGREGRPDMKFRQEPTSLRKSRDGVTKLVTAKDTDSVMG
jgi:hypothetical protein